MKTKLILMAILLTGSTLLLAGPCEHHEGNGPNKERHSGKQLRQQFLQDLNMSEAQQKSFDIIMENKKEKMKAAQEVIHNETQAELSEILTEEQMQMLDEKHQKMGKARKHMKKQMRKRMHKRQQQ